MDRSRHRRPGEEAAPKSSFSQELEAKMKDRRSRGLATDVTESEDELGSDDELMAHFNMTNKPQASPRGGGGDRKSPWDASWKNKTDVPKQRSPYNSGRNSNQQSPHEERLTYGAQKSPYDDHASSRRSPYDERVPYSGRNRQAPVDNSIHRSSPAKAGSPTDVIFGKKGSAESGDDMLRTMKQPGMWKPPSANTRTSPAPRPHRSSYDDASEDDSDEVESVMRQKPLRHEEVGKRPTSQDARGRKTPNFRDSLDDQDERPNPTPRNRPTSSRPTAHDTGRDGDSSRPRAKPRTGKDIDRDNDRDVSRNRRTPTSEVGKKGRTGTPKNDDTDRKTPTEHRKSLFDVMDDGPKQKPRKRTNLLSDSEDEDDQKSMFKPVPRGRKTDPYDDLSNERQLKSNRKSPFDDRKYGRPSRDLDDNERSKSRGPSDSKEKNYDRKSPLDFVNKKNEGMRRKSPFDRYNGEDEEDRYTRKDTKAQRSPWRDDRDVDERKKVHSKQWKEDGDEQIKRRRSPWEDEVEKRMDRGEKKSGMYRKFRDEEDKSKAQTGRKSPWERQDREEDDKRMIDRRQGDENHRSHQSSRYRDEMDGDQRHQKSYDDRDKDYKSKYRHRYDDSDDDDDRHQRRDDHSDNDDDDDRYDERRHKQKPKIKDTKKQSNMDDEPSSVCGDVEVDPTMRPPQTKEGRELEKKQPRYQRKEKRHLDDAIDTIKDAQMRSKSAADGKMRYINPAQKANRPLSSTSQIRPKPRYPSPNTTAINPADFNSTTSIRDSVYQQWYEERMKSARQEKFEKSKRQEEEENNKKKAEEDKFYGAKVSYNTWLIAKTERINEETRKKAQAEAKKKKVEEDKTKEKRKDADTTFRLWKEEKDIVLKKKAYVKKKAEEDALKERQDKEYEKRKDAEKVFRGWKSTKDEILVAKAKEKDDEEHRKTKMDRKVKRRREREATSSYFDWLEKKENQTQNDNNLHRFEDDEEEEWKPAWKPNTSTIPFGR